MITAATLAPINDLGRLYAVGIREDEATTADGDVFHAMDLADFDGDAATHFVVAHGAARGIEVGKNWRSSGMVAGANVATLAFQRYCHRIARVALAAMMTGVTGLDLSAAGVSVVVNAGMPTRVLVTADPTHPTHNDAALFAAVTDAHLALIGEELTRRYYMSPKNVWGNIAAGWAMAARHLSSRFGIDEVRGRIEPLMRDHPLVARGGSFVEVVTSAGRERLFYERTTCCKLFTVRDVYCSWCSNLSHDERLARFRDGGHSRD